MANKHVILKTIYNLSLENNSELYLIGSRLLKLETENSDWDCLIKCSNPQFFYKQILHSIPEIQEYNQNELFERAQRYSFPNSPYSTEELFSLFEQTCVYTKYENKDIGLFFVKSFQNEWAESTDFINSLIDCTLIKELSDSYSMPRIISVKDRKDNTLNVLYTDWLLCGIENCKIGTIDFFNLWKVNDNLFILDNEKGYVKFH